MTVMSIPEDVYYGYYTKVCEKYPEMDSNLKWTTARKKMIEVLKEGLR